MLLKTCLIDVTRAIRNIVYKRLFGSNYAEYKFTTGKFYEANKVTNMIRYANTIYDLIQGQEAVQLFDQTYNDKQLVSLWQAMVVNHPCYYVKHVFNEADIYE